MNMCPAKFEPDMPDRNTHTCAQPDGHQGDHLCPQCNYVWSDGDTDD